MPATPPLELRDYQNKIIEEIQKEIRYTNSILVTAPTGAGKTVILSEVMARVRRRGLRAVLLVHRQELVKQSEEKLTIQTGEPPGVVWQNRKEWDNPLLIMAQGTVMNMPIPEDVIGPEVMIVDEAHHTVAPSWLETIKRIRPKYLLGFSATPFRQDREPLYPKPFGKIIRPITPKELIDRGVLCQAIIESPVIYSLAGDVQKVNQASNLPQIYRDAVRYAVSHGRSKILLYVSQTAQHTPHQVMEQTLIELRGAGITAGHISQNHSTKRREQEITKFIATPGASVLLNFIALTEGTDIPLVDCVILGRHTESESTIIQMIGRGLRTHQQKEDCLVLDYSGRPDMNSIIHYWRLDQPREKGGSAPKNREQPTKEELRELSVKFSKQISPLGETKVQYSWFRPFPKRPLQALPLWRDHGQPERYLTVEALKDGEWRISTVTLRNSGPTSMHKRQNRARDEEDALSQVRGIMGEKAPLLQRDAKWRMLEASERQKQAWKSIRPKEAKDDGFSLSGEISDAIAKEKFIRRVKPETI